MTGVGERVIYIMSRDISFKNRDTSTFDRGISIKIRDISISTYFL